MMRPANVPPATFRGTAITRRPAFGWGISLLVHAIGIGWPWHAAPLPPAPPDSKLTKRIAIWIVPGTSTPPSRASAPAAAAAAAGASSDPALTRAAAGRNPPVRQPRLRAVVPAPVGARQAVVDAIPLASAMQDNAAPVAAGEAPVFDLAAARASARALAGADDRQPMAPSLRQGNKDAITSERIQERFERARRANCLRENESTNLLANVLLLAKDVVANAVDDSGCKW